MLTVAPLDVYFSHSASFHLTFYIFLWKIRIFSDQV
nr:MAG TPA: hypothetical protein [Crassvirales sp.]